MRVAAYTLAMTLFPGYFAVFMKVMKNALELLQKFLDRFA